MKSKGGKHNEVQSQQNHVEEAKEWEESWNMCREQVRALSRQSDIISMVLKMDDVELLDLAFGFVRGCYNQQIKKEQEAENNGEM